VPDKLNGAIDWMCLIDWIPVHVLAARMPRKAGLKQSCASIEWKYIPSIQVGKSIAWHAGCIQSGCRVALPVQPASKESVAA
jgi:hypothetical protein